MIPTQPAPLFLSCVFLLSALSAPASAASNASHEGRIHPTMLRLLDDAGANQPVKAWVLFEPLDKGLPSAEAHDAAIDALSARYNHRAIQRRQLRRTLPGLFDRHDLPVSSHYLDRIRATGASIHVVSRWLNGASVLADRSQLEQIAQLPFVKIVQPVRRGRGVEPVDVGAAHPDGSSSGASRGGFYGESATQLAQINLLDVHTAGYTGAGVIIGILDTGFQRSHAAFNDVAHPLNVVAEFDFINLDWDTSIELGDPSGQHSHGTMILGTLGAYKPQELVGAAYDASFILCKTEDITIEQPIEEDNYVAGLEFIEANGGDLATASLAYIDWYTQDDLDGLTAITTIAVNIATGNGLHCCNAARNAGHDSDPATSSLGAPADAFDVLTCGAVDDAGVIAGFSSDGPTADGRVKPEVLARGVNTRTVSSSNDVDYTGANGTSLSTPLVAGVVACLVQAHPDWTVEQMRSYLFHTADYYVANQTYDPLYVLGYGVIDALAAVAGDCNGNGTGDATDIADTTSADCNSNGIPDECDIAYGTSLDLDGDGILDECGVLPIPTVSTWGASIMTLLLLIAGTILFGRPGSRGLRTTTNC